MSFCSVTTRGGKQTGLWQVVLSLSQDGICILLPPKNTPPNGELYAFVTNRDAKTREGSLVAVVAGTKSEDVIVVLERIDEDRLNQVKEVTLDLSDSMRRIIINVFPKAQRVIDRFHIQKLGLNFLR